MRVLVDEPDERRSKETVGLAHIHINALKALLAHAAVLILVAGTRFGFALLATSCTFFVFGNILHHGRVLVVVKQPVELVRQESLHQFLARQPRQLVENGRQILRDGFLVHLHILDAARHGEELLLDNHLGCRHIAAFKFLTDVFLDLFEFALLAAVNDGDAHAILAGTACAAAAVVVDVVVVGQTIADDVREVVDIESAGGHIGGNEQLQVTLAELLHHGIALCLREIAMQRIGIITVLDELRRHLLCSGTGAAKDDAINPRQVVHNALECQILLLGIHHIVDVMHIGAALVARAHHILLRIVHVVLGNLGNFAWHGGREEQHLAVARHIGKNLVDVVDKAHVQHLVGLVKHHGVHILECDGLAVDQVDEAAWRGHHHLHTLFQRLHLRLDVRTAIHGQNLHIGHIL